MNNQLKVVYANGKFEIFVIAKKMLLQDTLEVHQSYVQCELWQQHLLSQSDKLGGEYWCKSGKDSQDCTHVCRHSSTIVECSSLSITVKCLFSCTCAFIFNHCFESVSLNRRPAEENCIWTFVQSPLMMMRSKPL